MLSNKAFYPLKAILTLFGIALLASAIAPTSAQAQKFKVLYTFHGANGAFPEGQLALDGQGNLYGTAAAGGAGNCSSSFDGKCGVAFKLDKTGKQVWMHSFNGSNGDDPTHGVLLGAGGLYGTTVLGGDTTCYSLGCGTVFKLNQSGNEKLLYQFSGTPDGWFPSGPLTQDSVGNLYGTTQVGGSAGGVGTVFKVDKTGQETVLYSFTGASDGCYPFGGVTLDAAGNLYGVALVGGASYFCNGDGVVYELDTTGHLTVLHEFGGGDGYGPGAQLIFDSAGNLYGTTENGGSSSVCLDGCGTVFELSPNGNGSWTETVLYSFCSLENCADGQLPHARLVQDASGNLYGTTWFGGADNDGVVFELAPNGTETVLHSFTGGRDGLEPDSLILAPNNMLLGVAVGGGDTSCPGGCGVVFAIAP